MATSHAFLGSNHPRVATIDERFSSYNVEMVEVIGGRFWKPYALVDAAQAAEPSSHSRGATPAGLSLDLYEQRPPIDLNQSRLRMLARALGPAYCRVSGTWANDVYFHDEAGPPPSDPPAGFGGVLTREQWRGVVEFCEAVDAPLVTSIAVSDGVRDEHGNWQPEQAQRLLDYTEQVGGAIAATEFMNEPNFAAMGHAPKGYDAAWFGRDVAAFRALLADAAPDVALLGPGSVGEGGPGALLPEGFDSLTSEALLEAAPGAFAAFSYHFYGAISERVATMLPTLGTTVEKALTQAWLSRTADACDFYAALRDRHLPAAPIWLTETAQAAGGGDRWAATFVDTFRFLYQLGSLAQRGVHAVFHNTLCASDYGLIDDATLKPRPNYWAALLWRRFMGTAVFDPGSSPEPDVYVFLHSSRANDGLQTALVINASGEPTSIDISRPAERYTLTATDLRSTDVLLNGEPLTLAGDELPALMGEPLRPGVVTLPATSVTFLTIV